METVKIRSRRRQNPAALVVFPVLFALVTIGLFYITVMPAISPYVGLAGLFISDKTAQPVPAGRDLFAEATLRSATAATNDELPVSHGEGGGQISTARQMIPLSSIIYPNSGDLYGRLTIAGTNIDAPVYWNDSPKELNAGIGTYTGGWLPGFGRTVMLAGHRNSYLRDLGSAETGGIITVETHYETYTYEIINIEVFHMNDSDAYDFSRNEENIIIYTCYPFDFIGAAKYRYFVYGELVSGMQIDRMS